MPSLLAFVFALPRWRKLIVEEQGARVVPLLGVFLYIIGLILTAEHIGTTLRWGGLAPFVFGLTWYLTRHKTVVQGEND
jgi:hypothetical protein